MLPLEQHSTLFSCLYDEYRPVGVLGRGAHHAVLRSVEWHDWQGSKYETLQVHDFVVLWDENQDTRIIQFLERIYEAGLLGPVQFIGKRNHILTVVVGADFPTESGNEHAAAYINAIEAIAMKLTNPCDLRIAVFDRDRGELIQRSTDVPFNEMDPRLSNHLAEIDSRWDLGTKHFSRSQG